MDIVKNCRTDNLNNFQTKSEKINYIYHIVLYIFAFCDFYISFFGHSFKLFYIVSIPCLTVSFVNIFKTKLSKIDVLFLLWIFASVFALGVTLSVQDVIVCIIGEFVLFLLYKDLQLFLKNYNISINKTINFISNVIFLFCLYGILQYLLYKIIGINIGVSHIDMFPRPRSVFLEPDWFGMYSCVGSSIFLIDILYKRGNQKFNYFAFFVCFLSMLLSFTRAAWVAFAFGIFVLIILLSKAKRKKLIRLMLFGIVLIGISLLILIVLNSNYIRSFLTRLNPFKWLTHDNGASDTRTYSIEIMIYYIKMHPLFGNGSGSMNYISNNRNLLNSLGYYYEINAGRGNANLIVATLFDIGIFGFLIFLYLIILIYKKIRLMFKNKNEDMNFLGIIGLVIFWNFMIDFQFNNGIRFSTVWLFFGLCIFFSKQANNIDSYIIK